MTDDHQEGEPRQGMPSRRLPREHFRRRYLQQFVDPGFDRIRTDLNDAAEIAWQAYEAGRKAPLTRKAGPEFHDPSYDLSLDWLDARAISAASFRSVRIRSNPGSTNC